MHSIHRLFKNQQVLGFFSLRRWNLLGLKTIVFQETKKNGPWHHFTKRGSDSNIHSRRGVFAHATFLARDGRYNCKAQWNEL
jgi:hypothetical protein